MSLNKWSNEEFRCWEPNRRFEQQFQTSQVQSEKQYENREKFIITFTRSNLQTQFKALEITGVATSEVKG